jgi:hypothetical protein
MPQVEEDFVVGALKNSEFIDVKTNRQHPESSQ